MKGSNTNDNKKLTSHTNKMVSINYKKERAPLIEDNFSNSINHNSKNNPKNGIIETPKNENRDNSMIDEVKKDILKNLNEIIDIISHNNSSSYSEIKKVSNQVIHDLSIYQDRDSLSFAVAIYAVSKILEKAKIKPNKLEAIFLSMRHDLLNNDIKGYRNKMKALLKVITSIDKKLNLYVQRIIEQAKVKKGAKIYDHGISLELASQITGIPLWDLMNYIGNTKVYENALHRIKYKEKYSAVSRYKYLLNLFD